MAIATEPLRHRRKTGTDRGYVNEKQGNGKYKRIYFPGEFHSREMWDAFTVWRIAQLGQKPADRTPALESLRHPGDSRSAATVLELCANFIFEVEERRCNGTKADRAAITHAKRSMLLLAPFQWMLADDINGQHLEQLRNTELKQTNNTRKTINEKLKAIAYAFDAGRLKKLCTSETDAIVTAWVERNKFKSNDIHVRGATKVNSVPESTVRDTITLANPTIATMMTVHMFTGMRSTNLCMMRWQDIDQSMYESDGVWLYVPVDHKMSRMGFDLPIYLGPEAITAILDYEKVRPDQGHEYLFNPRATRSWRYFSEQKTLVPTPSGDALRILKALKRGPVSTTKMKRIKKHYTSELQKLRRLGYDIHREGHHKSYNVSQFTLVGVKEPTRRVGTWSDFYRKSSKTDLNPCFSEDTYRLAVQRVQKKNGIPKWFPHQLRHLHTTKIRHAEGVEAAQAVIGHFTAEMTENYSDKHHALARKCQKSYG